MKGATLETEALGSIKCIECEVVDWIELAEDKVKWQALVNAIQSESTPQSNVDILCASRVSEWEPVPGAVAPCVHFK
jgi:hypothetical protein